MLLGHSCGEVYIFILNKMDVVYNDIDRLNSDRNGQLCGFMRDGAYTQRVLKLFWEQEFKTKRMTFVLVALKM